MYLKSLNRLLNWPPALSCYLSKAVHWSAQLTSQRFAHSSDLSFVFRLLSAHNVLCQSDSSQAIWLALLQEVSLYWFESFIAPSEAIRVFIFLLYFFIKWLHEKMLQLTKILRRCLKLNQTDIVFVLNYLQDPEIFICMDLDPLYSLFCHLNYLTSVVWPD